jgi:hypothetical protein
MTQSGQSARLDNRLDRTHVENAIQAGSIHGDITIHGRGRLDLLDAARDFAAAAQEFRRTHRQAEPIKDEQYFDPWMGVREQVERLVMFAPDDVVEAAWRVLDAAGPEPSTQATSRGPLARAIEPEFTRALDAFLKAVRRHAAHRGRPVSADD